MKVQTLHAKNNICLIVGIQTGLILVYAGTNPSQLEIILREILT